MANQIRFKRASGSDPSASDLAIGEPGLRTDTAELFFKKDDGTIAKVSGGGGGPDFKYLALRNAANNGAASYPNADFTLVTSGTTNAITPVAANTLLVSVNGVIQKPNTGTSTPSQGFALSGSTIKFGANISAAPDFILYQESGGIGEPSDETVSEAKLKVSNSPVNGYFLSAQSGNTGGLTWAAPVATSCTGNSATATALATARAINGVNFDGTAAITVTAAAGTLSGNTLNSSVVTSSLTSLGDLTSLTVTGDLVVDTSTLKVDSSNNRVGIKTATPQQTLEVVGQIAVANASGAYWYFDRNDTNGDFEIQDKVNGLKFSMSTTGDITATGDISIADTIVHTGDTNTKIRFPSNDNISFEVAGVERLRIDNADGVIAKHTTAANLRVQNSTAATGQVAQLDLAPANALSGVQLRATSEEDFSTGANRTAFFSAHVRKDGTFYERMRIDSSGRVLINVLNSYANADADNLQVGNHNDSTPSGITLGSTSNSSIRFSDAGNATDGWMLYNHSDTSLRFGANNAERMRISSDDIFIGKTSDNFDTAGAHIDDGGQMVNLVKSGTGDFIKLNRSTNVGVFIEFRRGSSNSVGNISSNNTTTSYNTSSDYRLKENVVAISDGITRLKTLKPSRFNFKTEKDTTVDGFLAHEVTAVPEAITGTKDEVDSDNNPIYQGIDQSKLVPLLVAALQEAIGRIEALEAK